MHLEKQIAKAYAALKQQENIITLQAVNANKLLEASELSLRKLSKLS
jgi:hypothetical protein